MPESITYKDAGVDTETKDKFIDKVLRMMRRTYDPAVIEKPWGFAGLYSLGGIKLFERNYRNPILVGCTDGVGTKLRVASMVGKHTTVGIDLVAMSINDLIVMGASPLFFLDYIAIDKVSESILSDIVSGIVEGCKQAGCALLGGETAEMPDLYKNGDYDLAGFAVGIVEKSKIVDGKSIKVGDEIIGIYSSGLHSNGYSLARKILFEKNNLEHNKYIDKFGCTLGEELLKPTRIYAKPMRDILRRYKVKKVIKGIANITGGGMIENIPRILPSNCTAEIYEGAWHIPPIFSFIQAGGNVPKAEMFRVFNMGIGMIMIVDPFFSKSIIRRLQKLGEKAVVIGKIVKGKPEVRICG